MFAYIVFSFYVIHISARHCFGVSLVWLSHHASVMICVTTVAEGEGVDAGFPSIFFSHAGHNFRLCPLSSDGYGFRFNFMFEFACNEPGTSGRLSCGRVATAATM